jgi:hexosaminidase
VPDGVDAKHILGGQGNLWTEQIPNLRYAYYMTYPRAWALSEVFWSQKKDKNWGNFSKRMESHFQRYDVAQKRYSTAVYDPIITSKKDADKLVLHMASEIPGHDLHYAIDDVMPDNFSPKYSAPVTLPEGPITLRVQAYRNGQPIGHLITLTRKELEGRVNW